MSSKFHSHARFKLLESLFDRYTHWKCLNLHLYINSGIWSNLSCLKYGKWNCIKKTLKYVCPKIQNFWKLGLRFEIKLDILEVCLYAGCATKYSWKHQTLWHQRCASIDKLIFIFAYSTKSIIYSVLCWAMKQCD